MTVESNVFELQDYNGLDAAALVGKSLDVLRQGTLWAMKLYSLPYSLAMDVQYTMRGKVVKYVIDWLKKQAKPDDEIDWSASIYRTDNATKIQVGQAAMFFIFGGPTATVVN